MNSISNESASILIIDNDPIMLTGIAAVLNMSGYECFCARNRETAIKAAQGNPLDLIISDVSLGGECGIELCQEMLHEMGMDDVPVMFMSSAQGPDIIRKAETMGGAYFLRKPFDPAVLIEVVGRALWMPHLVQSRVQQLQAEKPAVHAPHESTPAPLAASANHSSTTATRLARTMQAINGLKMPLA